jgi:hypothetical protein
MSDNQTERNAAMKRDIKTMSLGDVAIKYGLTRQRVSQIVGSIKEIREPMLTYPASFESKIVTRCEVCSKDIWHYPALARKFCSYNCFGAQRNVSDAVSRIVTPCAICGKDIWYRNSVPRLVCGISCRGKYIAKFKVKGKK